MPDRPTLYVLVDLPGAGKSSYAEELRDESNRAVILSSDFIRWTMAAMAPEYTYKSHAEQFVFGVIENFARGCLAYGRDVIIDATNLKPSARLQYLGWALEWNARVECHVLECSVAESARRSRKHISKAAVEELAAKYYPPALSDGWDRLVTINVKTGEKTVEDRAARKAGARRASGGRGAKGKAQLAQR